MMNIDLAELYTETGTAKLADLEVYLEQVNGMVAAGAEVVLTGRAPVWLYLLVAHELHGRVRCLKYDSPVTGERVIYDHNPY